MFKLFGGIATAKSDAAPGRNRIGASPRSLTEVPSTMRTAKPAMTTAPRKTLAPAPQKALHEKIMSSAASGITEREPRIARGAHSPACSQIPVSVLRNALPLRFAAMSESCDEFVFR